jgi:hypothetical protein
LLLRSYGFEVIALGRSARVSGSRLLLQRHRENRKHRIELLLLVKSFLMPALWGLLPSVSSEMIILAAMTRPKKAGTASKQQHQTTEQERGLIRPPDSREKNIRFIETAENKLPRGKIRLSSQHKRSLSAALSFVLRMPPNVPSTESVACSIKAVLLRPPFWANQPKLSTSKYLGDFIELLRRLDIWRLLYSNCSLPTIFPQVYSSCVPVVSEIHLYDRYALQPNKVWQ